MILILTGTFIFLSIFGLFLLWLMNKQGKKYGVLTNQIIYSDTEAQPGEVLYSKTLNLVGKPDYLIKKDNLIIPVEKKTCYAPHDQYANHNMQLMAYCFLVEENFGIKPPGGYIKYLDKELKLAYGDRERQAVIDIVNEILEKKRSKEELHCHHKEHYPKINT